MNKDTLYVLLGFMGEKCQYLDKLCWTDDTDYVKICLKIEEPLNRKYLQLLSDDIAQDEIFTDESKVRQILLSMFDNYFSLAQKILGGIYGIVNLCPLENMDNDTKQFIIYKYLINEFILIYPQLFDIQ
jgi:hypothetical protein